MTDRRIGGADANVDIKPQTDQRAGGLGVQVDAVPPQTFERQTDALLVNVEVVPPTGDVASALGVRVDLIPASDRRAAWFGALVEYVSAPGLLPLVRWPGAGNVFQITGSAAPTHWQASSKQLSTLLLAMPLVQWNTTLKRFVLPDSLEDLYYDGTEHLSYAGLEGLFYGG